MSAAPQTIGRQSRSNRVRGTAFYIVLLACVSIGFVLLGALLFDVVRKGFGYIDPVLLPEPDLARTRRRRARGRPFSGRST